MFKKKKVLFKRYLKVIKINLKMKYQKMKQSSKNQKELKFKKSNNQIKLEISNLKELVLNGKIMSMKIDKYQYPFKIDTTQNFENETYKEKQLIDILKDLKLN